MKKIILITFILSCLGISWATVGGPTIIDNIYYDQTSNSIRYSQSFYNGLGGSKIFQYGLDNKQKQQITQLGDMEFMENRLMSDLDQLNNYFINQGFTPLKEFQLDKLAIKISLKLDHFNQIQDNESFQIIQVAPYDYIDNPENYMMSGYVSSYGRINTIYLGDQILSQIPISTCRLDPINFRGMGLENLDTTLIIVSSAKKDCREGGYLGEEAHIIDGITPNPQYFLAHNSQTFDPYNYVPNRELKPTTGGLYIQPQMEGDNMVQGNIEVQKIEKVGLWDRLIEWIKKILGL
ncbi:hypothetical protein K9M48_03230 [Candidatus Gracilibacteria bacterium]|nr:hypothetical protein [Candidatus Gracilibacteria bacterium]